MEEAACDKSMSLCDTPKDSGTAAPQRTSSGKQPMSAALRERLRKTRRSFNANFTVAKRLKIDTEEKDCADVDSGRLPKISMDCSTLQDGSESLERNCTGNTFEITPFQENDLCESAENVVRVDLSPQQSLEEKVRLMKQVKEKEELLRRLKLVKMYRSKNNLSELQALIGKWRSSTQLMLYELQSAFSADGKKASLSQLIDTFGLEDQLLHYSRTEEDFVDT
ncbi:swi5-dependent recombination DNA repair protein 1 homolog isoform X2 [Numida meleagris]|nr:swi5-dependent recombination DNA repair protein 1 homolog isoform X2 [Numida meleagris]XP_021254289.1 swi5-dependent recombination DNA repair protein 1 homolog isoform X2 [Numida meleagris]XP_021254290.1 swi5-dependent recombination DNA repair protein 1 homolog isoform X2 [Numida meleagris]XP_021254291.1 swi5-dependent recombination DNA repair protein 1 homolog isoform X2 [Numida meleagris]XP_021254292.1 swi5-dependent recombination DNA repair protein 1 homolog isoform X2 [Numida meleagris]